VIGKKSFRLPKVTHFGQLKFRMIETSSGLVAAETLPDGKLSGRRKIKKLRVED
jgi:hypothetical protein